MTLNPLSSSSSTSPSTSSPTSSSARKGGLARFYPTHNALIENLSTKKDETDFLATVPLHPSPAIPPPPNSLRAHIEQIVLSMPTDSLNDLLDADKGFLRVRQTLLQRHPRVRMRMRYRDAHVYVFPKWVKEFVRANEGFDSVSEDVLGWWAKAGWQGGGLAGKLGLGEALSSPGGREKGKADGAEEQEQDDEMVEEVIDAAALSSTRSTSAAAPPVQNPRAAATPRFATRVGTSFTPSDPNPNLSSSLASSTIPPLHAYIQPASTTTTSSPQPQPLIRRIDTPHQLALISLHLARLPPQTHPLAHEHKIHPSASIGTQTRISAEDSLVGENVTLGIRCNVKESVIGANCSIGNNVRLTKCVVMEGVVVGDGVTLTGCVVGRRARIEGMKMVAESGGIGKGKEGEGEKSKRRKGGEGDGGEEDRTRLTDCEVAPGFVVEAGTEAKGEKLMAFDTEVGMDGEEGEDEEMGDGEEMEEEEEE